MRGSIVPLSLPRRIVCDVLHFAAGVPTNPISRRMNLATLAAARAAIPERPSWQVLFVKAFAQVAAEVPELRRAYCKLPRPHLYEYPCSVATVTIERDYDGEKSVFLAKLKDPCSRSIPALDAELSWYRTAPIPSIKPFRRLLEISRLPRPVRRALWWIGLNVGRQRANYFGTFGLTSLASLGAESLHPLSPLTTMLTYGVIAANGDVDVRLSYDHRVLDGAVAARALVRLESVLRSRISEELLSLATDVPVRVRSRLSGTVKAAL